MLFVEFQLVVFLVLILKIFGENFAKPYQDFAIWAIR